jgi:hypothetical protein
MKKNMKNIKKNIKKSMKKAITCVSLALTLCCAFEKTSWASQAKMTRQQYEKNLTYNKNALPVGWKYEAGYTLWRAQRNLPLNVQTYKKYKRERAWRDTMRHRRWGEIALDTLDWTAEEAALFWQTYQELFKFHPSGVEN